MTGELEGGGASATTEPAYGTSSATDISLKEHINTRINALDRHISAELAALRRETQAANEDAERAIEVAAHEAADRLTAHNGLIEQMRQQAAQFATREALDDFKDNTDKRLSRIERFQSMVVGGLLFLSFVGAANLVKAWTG